MKLFRLFFLCLVPCSLFLHACTTVDLYEKNVSLPGFQWKSSFQPEFDISIKDSSHPYQLYIVLRHNEKYNYTNIWMNLYVQPPGQPIKKIPIELPLATNEKGWLATGMDDIYEHRIPITIDPQFVNFQKAGQYHFKLEQIMREDPLENVLSVGVRLEKKS